MARTQSLSLKASTGTIVKNADGTHEAAVLHIEPNEHVASGQVSIMLPVKRDANGNVEKDQGLVPGEYSISISLSKARQEPEVPNGSGNSDVHNVGTLESERAAARRRQSDVSGG